MFSELNVQGRLTQYFPALSCNIQSPNEPGSAPPVGEAGTSISLNVTNGSEQNLSPPVDPLENTQTTKSSTALSTLVKPLQSTSPPPPNKVKTANSSTSASLMEQKVLCIIYYIYIYSTIFVFLAFT